MSGNSVTIKTVRAGIIAALYSVLSLVTFPVASGAIQLRLSEGLCLLPLIFPEAIFGVTVGCFIVNLLTGCALPDVIFGSLITLVACALTYGTGRVIKNNKLKLFVGGLFPVFLNALLLPLIWYFCYGQLEYAYILSAAFLLAGESVSVYAVGIPAVYGLERLKNRKTSEKPEREKSADAGEEKKGNSADSKKNDV